MITKVSSYRTSDGNLHSTYIDAQSHETFISIKGLINSAATDLNAPINFQTHSVSVAKFIMDKEEEIVKLLRSLKEKKRRAKNK